MDLDDPTAPSGRALVTDEVEIEPTRQRDTLPGSMLGEYRVIEQLGHGGMGALYRGVQPVIDRPVAIKVLLPRGAHDPLSTERMIREARAANAVRHPNIIDIFSFGTLPDGRPYMVMELLEGRSLADELRARERLDVPQVLTVLEQSMAALEAAHAAGVVHRDLKPENIFVTDSPDGWRLKLIDFGLARRQDMGGESRLTQPGIVMGTPGFMAPEQVRGEADVTGKADIYAMGVVAWTLLMGREPYEGGSVVEIMHRHLSAPIPALTGVADAPQALQALVLRMMNKDAAQRPDASEVRKLVAQLRAAKPARGPGRAIAGLAAVGVLIVASTVALLTASFEEAPAPVQVLPPPRPLVAKPKPEPTPPPPVEVKPVAPVERPLPKGAVRAWPCEEVVEVTSVRIDNFDRNKRVWLYFQVTFQHERSLVVFGAEKQRAPLEKWARAASACKAPQRLAARVVDTEHDPFHIDFFRSVGGDVVPVGEFFVAPD